MRTRCWEYKTVKISTTGWWEGGKFDEAEFDELLNELGTEGWELVSILTTAKRYGGTCHIAAVFKRPNEVELTGAVDRPHEDRIRAL